MLSTCSWGCYLERNSHLLTKRHFRKHCKWGYNSDSWQINYWPILLIFNQKQSLTLQIIHDTVRRYFVNVETTAWLPEKLSSFLANPQRILALLAYVRLDSSRILLASRIALLASYKKKIFPGLGKISFDESFCALRASLIRVISCFPPTTSPSFLDILKDERISWLDKVDSICWQKLNLSILGFECNLQLLCECTGAAVIH